MADGRGQRLAELFKAACEQEDRTRFLDENCRSDPELRAELKSLLEHYEGTNGFMETPALHLAAESLAGRDDGRVGEVIGSYEMLSIIGSGGMGDVYLARDRELGRQVALKIIRRGMDSEDIIRRFRQEERLLANLNHPNIGQLYGGGITDDGVPYFAMEYVEGIRIDQYCDEKKLTIRERLELFRKVCAALHYAHQHLVVHRDIKPSNILVTTEHEPKLLDFGIGKLLETDAANELQTLPMAALLTPEYASPEHARGETITTASDTYSLGVLLYELLTGQRPYRVKTQRPDEIARIVSEEVPARPSALVRGASLQFAEGRIRRGGLARRNLKSCATSLRGDLDNIVLMALRKEPQRRYASVGQFSEDIRRHLTGLPVRASKDTFRYRASKFMSRHRVGVAATSLVFISLIAGMIATVWQAQKVRHENAKMEEIKGFLERTLKYSNKRMTGKSGRETTLTDVLDEAAKRLDREQFSNQPEVKAELEHLIGQSYLGEGKYAASSRHLAEYVKLEGKLHRADDPETLTARATQAWLFFSSGDLKASEKLYREILPRMRVEQEGGRIGAASLSESLTYFAYLRRTQGDSKEAESLFREALRLDEQMSSEDWRFINATTRSTLASVIADQGRFDEALKIARDAVREYGEREETRTPNFGFVLTVLGGLLVEKGEYAEADACLREAEGTIRKFFGTSSLWFGDNLRDQATSSYRQGRFAESLNKIDESLANYRENFGSHYDHYPTALIINGLALAKTGRSREGEALLGEALRLRRESLPAQHFWIALAESALGECLTIEKRYDQAGPLLRESYHTLKNSLGASNPRTELARQRLRNFLETTGRADEAACL